MVPVLATLEASKVISNHPVVLPVDSCLPKLLDLVLIAPLPPVRPSPLKVEFSVLAVIFCNWSSLNSPRVYTENENILEKKYRMIL